MHWLMLDNITFAIDLMAAETRSLLHQEAEMAATKIAVAAVAAAAAADNVALTKTNNISKAANKEPTIK